MLPLFSEAGPVIKQIAADRGIHLPPVEGVLSADVVARKMLECIYHPTAEVYTHRGSKEFAILAGQNREEAEKHQIPVVLGERAVYRKLKHHA
jgi:hypothetical protein